MTKLLLKSLYRRMPPMELRKFSFNWMLLRDVVSSSERSRGAYIQQISTLCVLIPWHTDQINACVPASRSCLCVADLLSSFYVPNTLLGSRNIIMLNKAAMVFCPQRTSKTTRAEELTAVTAAADVLLFCGVDGAGRRGFRPWVQAVCGQEHGVGLEECVGCP